MTSASAPRVCAAALLVLSLPVSAAAQAWLPADGEGTIAITYQGLYSRDHLDLHGKPFDKGRVTSHTLVTGIEYGITDRWAIDAKVAFVSTRHAGADRLHGPLDTGRYHATIQDARVSLAWQMPTSGPIAIAPYVAAIVPTHAYETRGHSAPGRRLRILQIGAWVGRELGRRAYAQAHGAFGFVERVGGMSVNRTAIDVEAGYAVSPRVSVTLAGAVRRTHGGLDFPLARDEHFDEVVGFHDRVARDNYFLLTSGMTVALGRKLSLYGTVAGTIAGQNTHKIVGGTMGVSWSFARGLSFGLN